MTPYQTYLVCYDIREPKRLKWMAKIAEEHGARLQKSVFMCRLTPHQTRVFQFLLRQKLDLKQDSVSFYPICVQCEAGATHIGPFVVAPAIPHQLIF